MFVKNNTITGKDGIWQIMGRTPIFKTTKSTMREGAMLLHTVLGQTSPGHP